MRSPSKCKMLIILARDVQCIGFWESFRIAIARAHHRDYGLTLSNLLASKFDIGGSQSCSVLAWTFVAEQFLYCARNQGKVCAQAIQVHAGLRNRVSTPLPIRFVVVS